MSNQNSTAIAPEAQDHCPFNCFLCDDTTAKARILVLVLEGLSSIAQHSVIEPQHFSDPICLALDVQADMEAMTEYADAQRQAATPTAKAA